MYYNNSEIDKLKRVIQYLACKIKNGGGEETDPIFTASPAHSITQADIDLWNAGGSGGDYVPMAGMDILAGERMQEGFLLANYNMLTDPPPPNSIAVGMSQELGGFVYSGTSTNGDNANIGSLNASPASVQANVSYNNSVLSNTSSINLTSANFFTGINGSRTDGLFTASTNISSNVDVNNKSVYTRISTTGEDDENGTFFSYDFSVSQDGFIFNGMPATTGDATFNRIIVQRNDGMIGWAERNPTLEFLPSIALGGSTDGTGTATLFRKGKNITVNINGFLVPPTTSKNQTSWYIGDIAPNVNCPFPVMFPVILILANGGVNRMFPTVGQVDGSGLNIFLPTAIQTNTTDSVIITAQFQVTNTNTID